MGRSRRYLANAFVLTAFGYSAPDSDAEAVELMKRGWGKPETRAYEQTELVNREPDDQLRRKYQPFIHSSHYDVVDDFYNSWIARHPRRSCEAVWAETQELAILDKSRVGFPSDWDELYTMLQPKIIAEKSAETEE